MAPAYGNTRSPITLDRVVHHLRAYASGFNRVTVSAEHRGCGSGIESVVLNQGGAVGGCEGNAERVPERIQEVAERVARDLHRAVGSLHLDTHAMNVDAGIVADHDAGITGRSAGCEIHAFVHGVAKIVADYGIVQTTAKNSWLTAAGGVGLPPGQDVSKGVIGDARVRQSAGYENTRMSGPVIIRGRDVLESAVRNLHIGRSHVGPLDRQRRAVEDETSDGDLAGCVPRSRKRIPAAYSEQRGSALALVRPIGLHINGRA